MSLYDHKDSLDRYCETPCFSVIFFLRSDLGLK